MQNIDLTDLLDNFSELEMLLLTKSEEIQIRQIREIIYLLLDECCRKLDAYDNRSIFFYYLISKNTHQQQLYDIESKLIKYEEKIKEVIAKDKNRFDAKNLCQFLLNKIFERQIKLDKNLKNLFSEVDKIEEFLVEKRKNIRSLIKKGEYDTSDLKLNTFNMQMYVTKLEKLENESKLLMNRYRSASNHIQIRIKSQFEIIDAINKLYESSLNFVSYETETKRESIPILK